MKNSAIDLIAFDADDTLWAHESIFQEAQARYVENLQHHASGALVAEKLYEYERRNLKHFGYGVKGFVLSMIETAVELTGGKINGHEIQEIIELGKWMLEHPVHVLEHVTETLEMLSGQGYRLLLITKGDLFDQESKIARSGLADHFEGIEIVSEKNEAVYQRIFEGYGVHPTKSVMIGNSVKSDILPVIGIGGHAIHIPFHVTWALEQVSDHMLEGVAYHELSDISMVPSFIGQINSQQTNA